MPKLSKPSNITLFPPVVSVAPSSSRYDLVFKLKWYNFEKEIHFRVEELGSKERFIKELNEALVEGSENKPYLIYD